MPFRRPRFLLAAFPLACALLCVRLHAAGLETGAGAISSPARLLLAGIEPARPADSPEAELIEKMLYHELSRSRAVELLPLDVFHDKFGEEGIDMSGSEKEVQDRVLAVGKDMKAGFVISGAYSRGWKADTLSLNLYDVERSFRTMSVDTSLSPDEDAGLKVGIAADRLIAGISNTGAAAVRKRNNVKSPIKATLWSLFPGGGMFYVGKPALGTVYFFSESAFLWGFFDRVSKEQIKQAIPWGLAALTIKLAQFYQSINAVSSYNRSQALIVHALPEGGLGLAWNARF